MSENNFVRDLNDYESMLAKSTCNVGIEISLPIPEFSAETISLLLKYAWAHCIMSRELLQVHLEPKKDQKGSHIMGRLGPKYSAYKFVEAEIHKSHDAMFQVAKRDCAFTCDEFNLTLENIGGSGIAHGIGTYLLKAFIHSESQSVSVFLCLCHAVSDGPGALQLVKSFLKYMADILHSNQMPNLTSSDQLWNTLIKKAHSESNHPVQPLIDLQSLLLGDDFGASISNVDNTIFVGLDVYSTAIKQLNFDSSQILHPEAMQTIPHDEGFNLNGGGVNEINFLNFKLNSLQTHNLRKKCRDHGATIQGAISAVSLVARINALGLSLPRIASVQVPINTRGLVEREKISEEYCLCGSAGIWHTVQINELEFHDPQKYPQSLFDLAKACTSPIKESVTNKQPQEWLRRLLNNPATLPPFSVMASSIGVAPITSNETGYLATNSCVNTKKLQFFGSALKQEHCASQAQGTMVHVVTFNNELSFTFNFSQPGVSNDFAKVSVQKMKQMLKEMADF